MKETGIRFHSNWTDESHLREFMASEIQDHLFQFLELSLETPEILICGGASDVGLRNLQAVRGTIAREHEESKALTCGCECRDREEV